MELRALGRNDDWLLEELAWLRSLAGRLLDDPNDADDVVQETWLRTREAPVRFESRGCLRAWLAGMARRMAQDTLRARYRRAARERRVARAEARTDAEDVVERSAQLEELLHAVRALEEPQRCAVLLRYLDGHSTDEIATALSVSEDVVRKRLSRARTLLRETLEARRNALGGARDRATPHTLARRSAYVAGALILALLGLRASSHAPETVPDGSDRAHALTSGAERSEESRRQSERAPDAEAPVVAGSSVEASGAGGPPAAPAADLESLSRESRPAARTAVIEN